jgi:cell division protein ZapA
VFHGKEQKVMDEKLSIHLLIDGNRYPLTIDREKEQFYREAAKQIDNKLNTYRSQYQGLAPSQYWAMAALDLSFENISMKHRNDTLPFTEKLGELTRELEAYIAPSGKDGEGTAAGGR